MGSRVQHTRHPCELESSHRWLVEIWDRTRCMPASTSMDRIEEIWAVRTLAVDPIERGQLAIDCPARAEDLEPRVCIEVGVAGTLNTEPVNGRLRR